MKRSPRDWLRTIKLDWSLTKKFAMLILLAAILPILLFGILTLNRSTRTILDGERQLKYDALHLYANRVNFHLEMYNVLSNSLFTNTELQDALVSDIRTIADLGKLNKQAFETILQSKHLLSALLLNEPGGNFGQENMKINLYTRNLQSGQGTEYVHPISDVENEAWYAELLHEGGMLWWLQENAYGQLSLRIARIMRHFDTLDIIGVLRIDTPLPWLSALARESYLEQAGYALALLDAQSNVFPIGENVDREAVRVLYGSTEQLARYDGAYYYTYAAPLNIRDWHVVMTVESKAFQRNAQFTILYALIALLLVLLASLLVSAFIFSGVIVRIRRLIHKILLLREDAYTPLQAIEGRDEIGITDKALNEMILHLRELIETEYRSRLENVTLRLDNLQEQINPHLLYNTLGAIEWRARMQGQAEICAITSGMIRFYKSALHSGEARIPLGKEMQMVADYVQITCYAYELEIERHLHVDADIAQTRVLRLLLQPIVENAIVHGLRYSATVPKVLEVSCKRLEDEDWIEILVRDNGVGMEEETRAALLLPNRKPGKNFGLQNVINRLRLYYAGRNTLEIQSCVDEGTTVRITICVKDAEDV